MAIKKSETFKNLNTMNRLKKSLRINICSTNKKSCKNETMQFIEFERILFCIQI